jgi:gliding motility-associated-like protein
MAVPKKKVSRSRRNMRRYSAAYQLDPVTWTNSVVSGLQAGLVTVTVTAGSGCVGVSQLTIEAVPTVELSSSTQKIICNNDCNGGIILQAVNGFLPYTFSLSTGSSGVQTGSLCSGTYTALVFDNKGCSDSTIINLVNPPVISFSFVSNNSSCATLADGTATITPLAGLAPYNYTITNGVITVTSNPAAGLSSGNYSISILDSLGCSAGSQTLAVVPTLTVIADAGQNFSVCANADVVISASLSVGADKFMWSTVPDNFTVSTSSNVNINILETTLLQLYAESTVQPGCFDTSLVKINVFERPYLDVGRQSYTMAVYASTVIGGNPTALSTGPSLTWTPADYLNDANAFNPVASNTLDVTYTVSMLYGAGCLESDTVQVSIVPEVNPLSGFSPNGDGKNDFFVIDYIDQFPNNEVEVYNRWGDRLFYSKGYQDPWDGTFKGQALPVGTYYYVIHLNHFAYKKPLTGPVTIFR